MSLGSSETQTATVAPYQSKDKTLAVTIHLYPYLSEYVDDRRTFEVDGKTIGECLENLTRQFSILKEMLFDEKGQVQNDIEIYLNKESPYPSPLERRVNDGDEISLVPFYLDG
jgi:molybdopterin converting factor small subunit